MPHRPGHGTQRKKIERQSRGQTPTKISKGAQEAANTALVNAEINRLNNLVESNQGLKNLASTNEQIIADMPDKFKDKFKDKSSTYYRDDGTLSEQGKYILGYYDDGRNQYQRMINNFIQSNPESAQAYAKRFPITNFMMKGLPLILRGGMGAVAPGFGMAANIIENLGGKASALGGLLKDEFSAPIQNIKDTLSGAFGEKEPQLTTLEQTQQTLNRMSDLLNERDDDIFTPDVQTDFVSAPNTLANNAELQRIFALPGNQTASFATQSPTDPTKANLTSGNYLVSDPGGFLKMATLPTGMAQGGIASLQDPNYNLLMNASDFDV
tara:strand:- start:409 stop:1383 length:975 start_codon:yes stop_codon:yes gene_type:complete